MTSTVEQTQKKDIIIIAVIHDDVPESSRKTIYAEYFYPLVRELESFTERKINIVFARGAPHSSFEYKSDDELATLVEWEAIAYTLLDEMEKEGLEINDLTKVILVTKDRLNKETLGAAGLASQAPPSGKFAIASLQTYAAIGHEVGHLLGATHEDSEIQCNGWCAETYVTPTRLSYRSNAYAFSPANRQNIKNYLADKD